MLNLPILELLQDCCDPPATRESLAALQARLGVRFPEEYVEFMLQFNGGYFPHPVICYLPEPTEDNESTDIYQFFSDGSDPDDEWALTVEWADGSKPPPGHIAVARSDGWEQIALNVDKASANFGKVWLWSGFSEEKELFDFNRIADSFFEFLAMLEPDNEFDREDRETIPIFKAIEYGDQREVERLLAAGVPVESRNEEERTLLMSAVTYQWPTIVRLLLQRSADPNARDRNGRTALHYAAEHSLDSARLLLAAGADAKVHDNKRKGILAGWSVRLDKLLRAHGAED